MFNSSDYISSIAREGGIDLHPEAVDLFLGNHPSTTVADARTEAEEQRRMDARNLPNPSGAPSRLYRGTNLDSFGNGFGRDQMPRTNTAAGKR